MDEKQLKKNVIETIAAIADFDDGFRDALEKSLDMTYGDFLLSRVLKYTKEYRDCPSEIFNMKVKDLISKSI